MGNCSMKYLSRIIRIALILTVATAAQSWAGGGQHYPNGAEDFAVGALPPPGTYLVNYLIYAQKNALMDNAGNNTVPGLKADVAVEVPRFIYVTPYKFLGANYGVQLFIPFYSADMQADVGPGGSRVNISREKGIGDMIFTPVILGWHFNPNLHAVFALDTWAPTGNYDKNRPATQIISRNVWTFEPVFAVSYLKNGLDLSAKLMYDFNTRNDETNTQPGQEFHMDWTVGYGFPNGVNVGVAGYNYWQTTDDEVNGADVSDQKSRIGGVGPALKYWPKHGPFSLVLKHYWEYDARNIAKGQQTMLKVIYAF